MEYYGDNDYREYLAHFGVRGMHWGIRRYQPYSVTGPRKGGKTGKLVGLAKRVAKDAGDAVANIRSGGKKKRQQKERLKNLEKARKAKAEKEKIMRSGDASKMLANKEKFSNQELDEFIARASKETKIAELKKSQIENGFTKADQIFDKVGKVADYVGTVNKLYKNSKTLVGNVQEVAGMVNGAKNKTGTKNASDGPFKDYDKSTNSSKAFNNDIFGNKSRKDDGPLSGDVEGVGKNSSANKSNANSRSKRDAVIDVEARDVTPSRLIGQGGSDNGGGRSDGGSPASSGGSSPRPTSPSSSGGGGGAALALPAPAKQAAKSSSMSEGIKLTFESAGGSNTKASAKAWQDFGKQSTAGIDKSSEAFKRNQDFVDEAIRNINDALSRR